MATIHEFDTLLGYNMSFGYCYGPGRKNAMVPGVKSSKEFAWVEAREF